MLTQRTPVLVVAALALMASSPLRAQEQQQEQPRTVIAVLEAQGNHATLLNAIRTAGLEEILNGTGPFVIFAPTDEAFAALPEGKLDELMANPEALKTLLTYHVTAKPISVVEMTEPLTIETLEGSTIQLVRDGETLLLQVPAPAAEVRAGEETAANQITATIITPNVQGSNGAVFVVDRVLLIES
jgi:uncharacterized surface protein with fasciclin (FAS1) repeats